MINIYIALFNSAFSVSPSSSLDISENRRQSSSCNILIFKRLVRYCHCPSWSLDLHFTLKGCLVAFK